MASINHSRPLESVFLMRKSEKKGPNSKRARCPIFNFFVLTRGVICQKMAPILDPVNFFWVFSLISHCEKRKTDKRQISTQNFFVFKVREGIPKKSCCSFGFCPNYLPPLPPIWTTCTTFFRRRNSRFKSQFRAINTIYRVFF